MYIKRNYLIELTAACLKASVSFSELAIALKKLQLNKNFTHKSIYHN